MYTGKKVLLIAGGGTIGTYVSEELLKLGATVEVICPEEKVSNNKRIVFHQSMASEEYLIELLSKNYYDGIINFLHYSNVEDYKRSDDAIVETLKSNKYLEDYIKIVDENELVIGNDLVRIERV
jgi:nucleoside-diphosphate-sugar epimerase